MAAIDREITNLRAECGSTTWRWVLNAEQKRALAGCGHPDKFDPEFDPDVHTFHVPYECADGKLSVLVHVGSTIIWQHNGANPGDTTPTQKAVKYIQEKSGVQMPDISKDPGVCRWHIQFDTPFKYDLEAAAKNAKNAKDMKNEPKCLEMTLDGSATLYVYPRGHVSISSSEGEYRLRARIPAVLELLQPFEKGPANHTARVRRRGPCKWKRESVFTYSVARTTYPIQLDAKLEKELKDLSGGLLINKFVKVEDGEEIRVRSNFRSVTEWGPPTPWAGSARQQAWYDTEREKSVKLPDISKVEGVTTARLTYRSPVGYHIQLARDSVPGVLGGPRALRIPAHDAHISKNGRIQITCSGSKEDLRDKLEKVLDMLEPFSDDAAPISKYELHARRACPKCFTLVLGHEDH